MKTERMAEELESLIPQIMRALYWRSQSDELSELPLAQLRMVKVLYESDKTPTELAEVLAMSLSGVTQLTHRLEESGWVERAADDSDRRVKHLRLSPVGRRHMDTRKAGRVQRVKQVLEQMTDCEQENVMDALTELLAACQRTLPPQGETIQLTAELEGRR